MKIHAEMESHIRAAAVAVLPALSSSLVDGDGRLDVASLGSATLPVTRITESRRGPSSAVYIAWDIFGTCRYVGSVRRPGAPAAVRERLKEHLQRAERLGSWYAVTVLPVQLYLGLGVLRECEGVVARKLRPLEGAAHPVPSVEADILQLVTAFTVRQAAS